MEYDIFKITCCGNGHDQIGARQDIWGFKEYNTRDINSIYRKAEAYNKAREYCGCKAEVKEVIV